MILVLTAPIHSEKLFLAAHTIWWRTRHEQESSERVRVEERREVTSSDRI